MHDARIQRTTAREDTVREYLQHPAVLAEHVSLEFRDPVRIGDETQMFEQQSADAAPLELVEYRQGDFRAMVIGSADVTADADQTFTTVLSLRRYEADVTLEVELG